MRPSSERGEGTMSAHISDLSPGDAIYARRAGNKRFAWYVIGRRHNPPAYAHGPSRDYILADAHRQHGAGVDRFMMFCEVRKIDHGRYA